MHQCGRRYGQVALQHHGSMPCIARPRLKRDDWRKPTINLTRRPLVVNGGSSPMYNDRMYQTANIDFWLKTICSSLDARSLWLNSLLQPLELTSRTHSAEDFSSYFTGKVNTMRLFTVDAPLSIMSFDVLFYVVIIEEVRDESYPKSTIQAVWSRPNTDIANQKVLWPSCNLKIQDGMLYF